MRRRASSTPSSWRPCSGRCSPPSATACRDGPDLVGTVWLAAVDVRGGRRWSRAVKYPANPPAVGDADTVGERTVQYLAAVVISLVLVCALTRLSAVLRHRLGDADRVVLVALATVVAFGRAVGAAAAVARRDRSDVPAELIWDFRIRSLGGLALYWAGLGLGLGWLLQRLGADDRHPRPRSPSQPRRERRRRRADRPRRRRRRLPPRRSPTRPAATRGSDARTLLDDPDALLDVVRGTKDGHRHRPRRRRHVAVRAGLRVPCRVAVPSARGCSTTWCSTWRPPGTAVAIGREPAERACGLDDPQLVAAGAHGVGGARRLRRASDRRATWRRLVASAPTGRAASASALLWSNVAARRARRRSAAFTAPLPDRRTEIRDRAEAFFAAARPELADVGPGGAGRATGGPGSATRCCLWYRTASGASATTARCGPPEERAERYDADGGRGGMILFGSNADTELLALRSVVDDLPGELGAVRWFHPDRVDGDPDARRGRRRRGAAARRPRRAGGGAAPRSPGRCGDAGIPLVALGGEAAPDPDLLAASTVPAGGRGGGAPLPRRRRAGQRRPTWCASSPTPC